MESISSIWAKDGTGKTLCVTSMSEKRFKFIAYCLRFDDIRSREMRRISDKLSPIREIFEMFDNACETN